MKTATMLLTAFLLSSELKSRTISNSAPSSTDHGRHARCLGLCCINVVKLL